MIAHRASDRERGPELSHRVGSEGVVKLLGGNLAAHAGDEQAMSFRQKLTKEMTVEEIREAETRFDEWQPAPETCDASAMKGNETAPE